jgi:hypothetical protein
MDNSPKNKKQMMKLIKSKSLKLKEEFKEIQNSEEQSKDDKKMTKNLESMLHILMIKLNHLQDFKFNFNLLLEYHKYSQVDVDKSRTSDMEKTSPYIKGLYDVVIEFLEFLKEITYYYNILDGDCFSFKKGISVKKFLEFYSKSDLSEDSFNFTTFFLPTDFCTKKIDFSVEIKEKNLILQHKFFILLNKFYEVYPLPKSNKDIKKYYEILINNILGVKIQTKNSLDLKIDKPSFFSCYRQKNKNELDMEKAYKMISPLMSLEVTHNSDINIQILKKLIFEFARSYLKVEELIFYEIESSEIDKMISTERQLIKDLTVPSVQ